MPFIFKGRATGTHAAQADHAEVRRAGGVFFAAGIGVQIQGLPSGKFVHYDGADLDSVCAACDDFADQDGIYWTLNAFELGDVKPVNNDRITRRRWVLIDVDRSAAVKDKSRAQPTNGKPGKIQSATDAEKEDCRAGADRIMEYLTGCGWPSPVLVDSGNGYHLLYRIDLPPGHESTGLIHSLLIALDDAFGSDSIEVDTQVAPAKQISKLPGTWARKGGNLPDRPHRLSRLLFVPDACEIVTADQIKGATPENKEAVKAAEAVGRRLFDAFRGRATNGDKAGFLRAVQRHAAAKVAMQETGFRNRQLYNQAHYLAAYLHEGVYNRQEIEDVLFAAACECGLDTDDGGPGKVLATIRSGLDSGTKRPLEVPERPVDAKTETKSTASAAWEVVLDGEVISFPDQEPALDGVQKRKRARSVELFTLKGLMNVEFPPVNWVVPGILSEGLNILGGKPKQGKSICALNLGITIAGGGMALKSIRVVPGDVLYLSLEDKQRRVQTRARGMLQGLEMAASKRLQIAVNWPRQRDGGLHLINCWAKRVERPSLVIIDVWGRFKPPSPPRGNAYEQDYEAMTEVKQLVDEIGCSALILHHCRKGTKGGIEDVLEEISGTMGLSGTADGIVVLARQRGQDEATLHITGRDVQDTQIALTFEKATLTWKSMGDAEQHVQGQLQSRILALLKGLGPSGKASDKEIAERLTANPASVRSALYKLQDKGLIRKIGYTWSWPGPDEFGGDSE